MPKISQSEAPIPGGTSGKGPPAHAGDIRDAGSIPGSGRSPGEGKGYPLQYSGLENSMNYRVHGVAKNRIRLAKFHFHFPLRSVLEIVAAYVIATVWLSRS